MNLSEKLEGLKKAIMVLENEKQQLEEQIEETNSHAIKYLLKDIFGQ